MVNPYNLKPDSVKVQLSKYHPKHYLAILHGWRVLPKKFKTATEAKNWAVEIQERWKKVWDKKILKPQVELLEEKEHVLVEPANVMVSISTGD